MELIELKELNFSPNFLGHFDSTNNDKNNISI